MSRESMKRVVFFFLLSFPVVFFAAPPQPEYWPTCDGPQNMAPMQAMGANKNGSRSTIAWNGSDYASLWIDSTDDKLWFRRFYADGTPVGPAVNPGGLGWLDSYNYTKIVWNGDGYGIAWTGSMSTPEVYFMRLEADGTAIGSPVKVSFYGEPTTATCFYADLAWGGNGYCVVWQDMRNTSSDIYATILDADGAVTHHDRAVCTAANDQRDPRVVWCRDTTYQVVWEDNRGTSAAIYGAQINQEGLVLGEAAVSAGTSYCYHPAIAVSGYGTGVAWADFRDGNYEIYFARLSVAGVKLGSEVRLTNCAGDSDFPAVVWTGAEYGVFFQDVRSGGNDTWFQRVNASGEAVGNNYQVTYSGAHYLPEAAFARYGYLATGNIYQLGNYISPWGCGASSSPPTCPGNLLAYNITGDSATVSWSLAGSGDVDIAYYIVYRNNSEIARTSSNYYADSGLGVGSTYNYMIQPVDAAQNQNFACTDSIYVKTNATLTLMLDKNDPDAHLYWNDAGLNNYNVFRGTSPQVMSMIGSTGGLAADDANVLLDNVNYFYTVDDPGQ